MNYMNKFITYYDNMVKIKFYVKASLITGCLGYTYYKYNSIISYKEALKQKFFDFKESNIQKIKDYYQDERVQQIVEKVKKVNTQAIEMKNQLKEIISNEEKINEIKTRASEKVERANQIKDGILEKVKESEKLNNMTQYLKSYQQKLPFNQEKNAQGNNQSQNNQQNNSKLIEEKQQSINNTVSVSDNSTISISDNNTLLVSDKYTALVSDNKTQIQQNSLDKQNNEQREINQENSKKDQIKGVKSHFFKKVEAAQNLKDGIKKNIEKRVEVKKLVEQISEQKQKLFSNVNEVQNSADEIKNVNKIYEDTKKANYLYSQQIKAQQYLHYITNSIKFLFKVLQIIFSTIFNLKSEKILEQKVIDQK